MRLILLSATLIAALVSGAFAKESASYNSNAVEAKLITAQDGVAPKSQTLAAGLSVTLEEGWKTYWRSPGEVGLPPELNWSTSENIESVRLEYPAPERFRAFGIENFGYEHNVLFPLQVTLKNPGEPAVLRGDISLLVCSDVCIPDDFSLELTVDAGEGIDAGSAGLIADAMANVPVETDTPITASLADDTLTIQAVSRASFNNPDVFPEFGAGSAFGAPDIRVSDDGNTLWAAFPVLALDEEATEMALTIVDDNGAVTQAAALSDTVPTAPYEVSGASVGTSFIWILFIALLGGLILNVMPCVLPVLSIKFASALKARDHSPARVRKGFLASAAGVMVFMWSLAAVLIAMRSMGQTVGWGLQFQSPIFLIVMLAVLVVFAANMFGLFEISLPQSWMTRMSKSGEGYVGDFATGALAAVLATPCSAPFLGTAVAFALAGSVLDVIGVFTALGVGLSAPYLLVALRPSLVQALPKPGPWMVTVKYVLGALLLATAVWLGSVLATNSGVVLTAIVAGVLLAVVIVLSLGDRVSTASKIVVSACLLIVACAAPSMVPKQVRIVAEQTNWQAFDRAEIPKLVAAGQTVFVDATADWCLTCKANKKLVLSQGEIAELLLQDNVVPMVADWTRQDENIARFLRANGRFGVPFNIVYGPGAPDGIALPELLTTDAVLEAFDKASG
ncbi:protein-disulfide reductase DsbD family protein [Falsihalocynthiibacter sp. SS001]|uniref:protein-disulfide reductase DsbD family protein n=1 Tax=Falsihalocynthiibacter sp. SS001 TaxID=3349698 RepID=UPI0036D2C6C4